MQPLQSIIDGIAENKIDGIAENKNAMSRLYEQLHYCIYGQNAEIMKTNITRAKNNISSLLGLCDNVVKLLNSI
jgi:hypothetical protein